VKARSNCRQRQPAHASSRAGSKTDKARGWRFHYDQSSHPRNPAESAALRATPNGHRERSNPPAPLHEGAAGQAHGAGGRDGPRSQGPRESRGIRRRGPRADGRQRLPTAGPPEHTGNGSVARTRSLRPRRRRVGLPSPQDGGLERRGREGQGVAAGSRPGCRDKGHPPGSWMSAKASRPVVRPGKAAVSSGSQSRRGNNRKPRSWMAGRRETE
jgi:hypothetical protein